MKDYHTSNFEVKVFFKKIGVFRDHFGSKNLEVRSIEIDDENPKALEKNIYFDNFFVTLFLIFVLESILLKNH